jgi:hypothetical protein
MALTETGERRADLKTQLIERMHDPIQLRIAVIGAVLLIGYCGVYMPLDAQIASTKQRFDREQKLSELAASVEELEKQCRTFAKRIPQPAENKEWLWIQYMQEGIRLFPVKLSTLECRPPTKIGPYPVAVLRIELEGSYFALDQFLRWLESNPRLLRADDIEIAVAAIDPKAVGKGEAKTEDKNNMVIRLTVLGLAS